MRILRALVVLSATCLFQTVFAQEIIVDNSAAAFSGEWTIGRNSTDKYLNDYQLAATVTNTATASATFTPEIITPGRYDVYVRYPQPASSEITWKKSDNYTISISYVQAGNCATDAQHFISFADGTETVLVNQTNSGTWQLIASGKQFDVGTNGFVRISNVSSVAGKTVVVDAVRLVPSAPLDPPTIITDPASLTTNAGSTATFSVAAQGGEPLSFQWMKNDVSLSDSATISGSATATLTIANVSQADAANYSVFVSNSSGSVTSAVATLVVIDPPSITTQPEGQTRSIGQSVTFSVEATGTAPLSYQWQFNATPISGATLSAFSKSNLQLSDAGNYSVIVSNNAGSVQSSDAALAVTGAPDSIIPSVAIVSPANNSHPVTNVLTLSGTAKDKAPGIIVDVKYRLLPGGDWNSATLSGSGSSVSWNVPNAVVVPGENYVQAYSVDAGGNQSAIKSNKFYFDSSVPLTVKITGAGQVKNATFASITNNQQISLLAGRSSSLTAFVPTGVNYVFTNWTDGAGSQVATSAVYNFVMQSNLVLQANFIPNPFTPVAGPYAGLFCDTNAGISHESAGFFTVKVTEKAAYSAVLFFDGDKISASGKFDLSGRASRSVSRATKGKPPVTLSLQLDWGTKISGTLSDGNFVATLDGERAVFNESNPANGYVGAFTFMVPKLNAPGELPSGFGYAAVTNSVLGIVKISGGALGDGAKLSQKVSLTADGQWPFYVPLYKTTNTVTNFTTGALVVNKADYRGSVWGWLQFSNGKPVGDFSWIKTDGASNYIYPVGFTSVLEVVGSPYSPPAKGVRALPITNGMATFSDGNLAGPMAWSVNWSSNNAITVSAGLVKPTFTLAAKTGLLKGTFPHPQLGDARVSFGGVLMQNQTNAVGTFVGTNQSGSLQVNPN